MVNKYEFIKALKTIKQYCIESGITCANANCPAYNDDMRECGFISCGVAEIVPSEWNFDKEGKANENGD